MRTLACLVLMLAFSSYTYAQNTDTGLQQRRIPPPKKYRAVSFYTTFAESGQNFSLTIVPLVGGSSGGSRIDVNRSFVVGIEHVRELGKNVCLNTGIEYSHRSLSKRAYKTPPSPDVLETGTIEMLSVPLYFRLAFLKYLFLTAGTVIDLEVKNNILTNQSGIAATGGFGCLVPLKNKKLSIIVHPYYELHNVIPLFHKAGGEHLLTTGVRGGLIYKF